jgi:hypothetical protein
VAVRKFRTTYMDHVFLLDKRLCLFLPRDLSVSVSSSNIHLLMMYKIKITVTVD